MTNIYQRFNKLADKLITKYGYSDGIIRRQISTGDKWNSEFETVDVRTKIIIVPSSKYSKETYRINGSHDIAESNYQAFIPYSDFIPTINDMIVVNDETFSIVSVIRIYPNGTDVLFKLELK